MRIFLIGFMLSSFLLSIDLQWEESVEKAFLKAKDSNKTVMIFVTKSDCRWCVKMKEKTFSNKIVKKQLENYILVKVDRNKLDNSLAKVKYFPTTLFYSPNKKLYQNVVGYFKVKDFISWLDDVERMVKR